MCDSLELLLLAVLAPTIHCLWHLSSWEEAFITTVSILWGGGVLIEIWVGYATGTLEPYHLAVFFDPVLDLALELPALSVISLEIEHTESWDSLGR